MHGGEFGRQDCGFWWPAEEKRKETTWKMTWVEEVKRTKMRMVLEAMPKVSNFPDFLPIAAHLPLLEVHQTYVGSGLRKTTR